MNDQSLQRMRQQQEVIRVRQTEEQTAQNQALVQENQAVTLQEERMLAQRMAEGLPLSGNAVPIPGERQTAAVAGEGIEAVTKRERRLKKEIMESRQRFEEEIRQANEQRLLEEQRRREQEQERLRQEEEQRRQEELRLQRAREAAEEEQVRQQRRRLILEDDEVRILLEQMLREQDDEKAMETAQAFLRKAAEKLLGADPELAEEHGGTVDYAGEMMAPFRMLIYSQMGDTEEADALFRETLAHEERFVELSRERQACSLISIEMDYILKEEFESAPLLARAADKMADQLSEQNTEQQEKWGDFEKRVVQEVRMPINSGETTANVFRSGSPYKYLTSVEMREAFKTKTEELMREFPMLTREEVQKQAAMGHWEELKEKAMKITLDNSVVPGVTKEDWAKHGGASFHHTLPAAQAYEAVSQSNGFLYAKPCGDGLCELRPTLPETVQIDGETMPLRRTYTLLIKALMHGILDENGNLREGAQEFADSISTGFRPGNGENLKMGIEKIRPFIREALGIKNQEKGRTREQKEDPQVTQVLDYLIKLSGDPTEGSIFGATGEIMEAFSETVSNLRDASENNSYAQKANILLKAQIGSEQTGPLTEEQKQSVSRIASVYADVDRAITEMLRIRKMDLDSPDVPLPNACSAHGHFIEKMRTELMGESVSSENELRIYGMEEHVKAHPKTHIQYILDHFEELKEKIGIKDDREYFNGLLAQENLAQEDLNRIYRITVGHEKKSPAKYVYHMAGNIGKLKNGERMTTEGFAAETKQYMVSPFSTSHAVGIYRGTDEEKINSGMVRYYNHDHALPTDAELEQVKVNLSIRSNIQQGG